MTFTIIPAIDLLDKQVVRLKQGRYKDVTFYDYSPLDLAKQFQDAGATRLHIVDLNGARDGSVVHGHIIESIRSQTSLQIEVGGGIRNHKSVEFYLNCGVNQLIIGSLFIANFKLAAELVQQYPQHIIAGVDAKKNFVATDGWEKTSELTLETLCTQLNPLPLHSVIYTDIAKDGMMAGPNLNMLETVANYSQHSVIASGGIRHKQDITIVKQLQNVSGCIVGKAILNDLTVLNDLF